MNPGNCARFLRKVASTKNSLLGRLGHQQMPHAFMNAVLSRPQGFNSASAHSSETKAHHQMNWCITERFTCHYQE